MSFISNASTKDTASGLKKQEKLNILVADLQKRHIWDIATPQEEGFSFRLHTCI